MTNFFHCSVKAFTVYFDRHDMPAAHSCSLKFFKNHSIGSSSFAPRVVISYAMFKQNIFHIHLIRKKLFDVSHFRRCHSDDFDAIWSREFGVHVDWMDATSRLFWRSSTYSCSCLILSTLQLSEQNILFVIEFKEKNYIWIWQKWKKQNAHMA